MSTDTDRVVVYLELVAAKAKQLAQDVKNGRLYRGDLSHGIGECHENLRRASAESRD